MTQDQIDQLHQKLEELWEKSGLSEDEIDYLQDFHYRVGKASMADEVSESMMKKAQHRFALGDDHSAKAFRKLANEYKEKAVKEHPIRT